MATLYPNSLDTFVNPTADSNMNDPAVAHHTQHANVNDAVRAIETFIGVASSTDVNSVIFKLNSLLTRTSLTLGNVLKTADYAISQQDYFVRVDAAIAETNITLPLAASSVGKVFVIKKIDSSVNAVVLKTAGSDLIDTFLTQSLIAQGDKISVISNGAGWNII